MFWIKRIFILLLLTPLSVSASQYKKYTVRSGDTIYSLLKRFQFKQSSINEILQNKKQFEQSYTLIPKQTYWVTNSKEGKFQIKFFHPLKDEALTFWKNKKNHAGFSLAKEAFKVKINKAKGAVNGSIIASIQNKVPSKKIAYRFLDAYKFQYNLQRILQKGAQFSLIYEEKYIGNQFVKYGEVLKTSLEIQNTKQNRYFIKYKDGGSFVNINDRQLRRPLYAPVNYLRITSLYQKRRFHPIKKRRVAHLGVDFELPLGSPILASLDGKIIKSGRNRAAGRYVVIEHKDGLKTYYNHMHSIADNIQKGITVKAGQKIGTIGCSGYCTKPHLHFSVKKHNKFVNPADYLKSFPFAQKEYLWNKISELKKETNVL